jgi:hypothetical protein
VWLVFGVVLCHDPVEIRDGWCVTAPVNPVWMEQSCRLSSTVLSHTIVVLARSKLTLATLQWLAQEGMRAVEVMCLFALALQPVAR